MEKERKNALEMAKKTPKAIEESSEEKSRRALIHYNQGAL
jgi:hypothetical protein